MASIPIVKTSFAHLFIRFLLQNGYPVRRWLVNARLPISLLDNADGYVSEYHLRKFIEDAAKETGLNELGLLVAETSSMAELGELTVQMKGEENLYESLAIFCHNVAKVNSHATFWLSQEHNRRLWVWLFLIIPAAGVTLTIPWTLKVLPLFFEESVVSPFVLSLSHLKQLTLYHGCLVPLLAIGGVVLAIRRRKLADVFMITWLIFTIDFSMFGLIDQIVDGIV